MRRWSLTLLALVLVACSVPQNSTEHSLVEPSVTPDGWIPTPATSTIAASSTLAPTAESTTLPQLPILSPTNPSPTATYQALPIATHLALPPRVPLASTAILPSSIIQPQPPGWNFTKQELHIPSQADGITVVDWASDGMHILYVEHYVHGVRVLKHYNLQTQAQVTLLVDVSYMEISGTFYGQPSYTDSCCQVLAAKNIDETSYEIMLIATDGTIIQSFGVYAKGTFEYTLDGRLIVADPQGLIVLPAADLDASYRIDIPLFQQQYGIDYDLSINKQGQVAYTVTDSEHDPEQRYTQKIVVLDVAQPLSYWEQSVHELLQIFPIGGPGYSKELADYAYVMNLKWLDAGASLAIQLTSGYNGGSVSFMLSHDGTTLQRMKHGASLSYVSPNQQFAVYTSMIPRIGMMRHTLAIANVQTGEVVHMAESIRGVPVWSPDSQHVVVPAWNEPRTVLLYTYQAELLATPTPGHEHYRATPTPVILPEHTQTFNLDNAHSYGVGLQINAMHSPYFHDWSPDGRYLVYSSNMENPYTERGSNVYDLYVWDQHQQKTIDVISNTIIYDLAYDRSHTLIIDERSAQCCTLLVALSTTLTTTQHLAMVNLEGTILQDFGEYPRGRFQYTSDGSIILLTSEGIVSITPVSTTLFPYTAFADPAMLASARPSSSAAVALLHPATDLHVITADLQTSWSIDVATLFAQGRLADPDRFMYHAVDQDQFEISTLTWSPDGEILAFWLSDKADRELWIVNKDGTELRSVYLDRSRIPTDLIWSPDATKILFIHNQLMTTLAPNTLYLYDLQTDTIATVHRDIQSNAAWKPDSRTIIYNPYTFIREQGYMGLPETAIFVYMYTLLE